MKRVAFTFLLFSILILPIFVSAQQNPGDLSEVLGENFNVSPDKIPTTTEDFGQIQQKYLLQEWTKVVEKNKFLGPIHKFFMNEKTQWFFKIVFARNYEISQEFFLTVVIWALIFISLTKLVESFTLLKKWIVLAIAFIGAAIWAQIRIIALIVKAFTEILSSQQSVWTKIISWVFFLGFLVFIYFVMRIISQDAKKKKEENEKRELRQKLKETKALTEPISRN